MIVLSLFDGISCGRVALERAGIPITKYYASEIDKYAIQIAQKNYPDNIQLGDINYFKYYPTVRTYFNEHFRVMEVGWPNLEQSLKPDLIIGGSPCQGFSFAGKQLAFDDPRSKLFFKFVEIVNHYKPKYFLLENVRMKVEYQGVISEMLGVEPICINSSLVSAQSRVRYYWTNIPNVTQPEDKHIYLKDIIEQGIVDKDKSYCIDANYWKGGNLKSYFEKHRRQLVFQINPDKSAGGKQPYMQDRVYHENGKSVALTASFSNRINVYSNLKVRKLTPIECERLQTLPDNYTEGVSNTQRYKALGNAWTVDVVAHIFKGLKNG